MSSALSWFPLVGLFLGLAVCGAVTLAGFAVGTGWAEGPAVVAVIAGVFLTRGIHLDGLADWADGFWGARDRERVLAIMKDPHVGAFGALAVVCVVLAKWVFLVRLIATGAIGWIVAGYVVSRTMPVVLLVAEPYARAGGGKAASFSSGAGLGHLAVAMLQALILVPLVCGLQWFWPAALLAGWGFTRVFGAWCRMRVGGITGDLLGACTEIVETAILGAGALSGVG